jgi:hypothetical protein
MTSEPNGSDERGRLRAEAARWRTRLREAEEGHAAAVEQARTEGADRDAGGGWWPPRCVRPRRAASPAPTTRGLLGDTARFVNEAGEVDSAAITAALDELLDAKPYLAARRTSGSADQGTRGSARPTP